MRSTGAAAVGFSLVWGVACGDTGSSDHGSSDQGSAVTDGGGTTGTTGGGATTSTVVGTSSSSSGGSTSSTGGSSTAGPVTSAGASTTGRAGAGPGGSDASGGNASGGNAGSGGAGSDLVDCSTEPCSEGEVCIPNAPGCDTSLGQCFEANAAFCAGGAVCGCDGIVYDNRCEAYRAHVAIDGVSECEQPAGSIACFDRFCDAGTESCQVVNESRCDGACLALCAGRHTVTYGTCVPGLTDCDAAACDCPTCLTPAVSCSEGDDGITLVCSSGCVG